MGFAQARSIMHGSVIYGQYNHPITREELEDEGGYCKVVHTVSKVALEYTVGLILIVRICEL